MSTEVFKPIIFQGEMVQAILDGRKTQTRRIVDKTFTKHHLFHSKRRIEGKDIYRFSIYEGAERTGIIDVKPKISVGNILWVRETWQQRNERAVAEGSDKYYHKQGWEFCREAGWKPSIHMPREAARIFLKVTNVMVQRLNYIGEQEAIAEGIRLHKPVPGDSPNRTMYFNYDKILAPGDAQWISNPIFSFMSLWNSIYGDFSFHSNPYVWVYTFERIDIPNPWKP